MVRADPERRVRALSGFGSIAAFSSCQNSPAKVTRGSVQRACIRRSPSLKRATRRRAEMPKAG